MPAPHERARPFILALCATPIRQRPNREPYVGTGVAIDAGGDIYVLTAGHVIERLKQNYERQLVAVPRLMDGHLDTGIPISLSDEHVRFVHDPLTGSDIGLLRLHRNQMDNLRANPAHRPLTPADFVDVTTFDSDITGSAYVYGYPNRWGTDSRVAAADGTEVTTRLQVAAIPALDVSGAERLRDLDEFRTVGSAFWTPHCLYSRVSLVPGQNTRDLDDIVGVSGGPIVVTTDADGTRLMGIQSYWHPPTRLLRWMPCRSIAEFMASIDW